jgi:hypothetical protein
MQVRWLLGWRAAEYDGWIRRGTIPLTDLQPGEMDLFTSYALAGFVLPTSSFFLTLLETYGLQLHHLTPYALALVVVFIHLCEMYVGMRPSVRLFRLFFTLRTTGRSLGHLGGYYFQHRGKSSATYISPFALGKWDRWRHDWVIVRADTHDRRDLPSNAPTNRRTFWEKVPERQSAYDPMLARIRLLAEKGLTSQLVLADFLSRRIAPLQQRARRPACQSSWTRRQDRSG